MTDQDRIAEIARAVMERDQPGKTHWMGCETDPAHRDCAISWLLRHEQALGVSLRALVQQWRELAARKKEAIATTDEGRVRRNVDAGRLEICADQLERLITGAE